MSLQAPSTYNPEAIALVIDGVVIDGFANEGITIEQEASAEYIEGMDGGGTYEWNASRLAKVTVTLRAASAGAKRLDGIRQVAWAALRAHQAHPDLVGVAADPVNGTAIESGNVFFLNKPMPDLAQQSGTVTYELAFVNYANQVAAQL